MVLLSYIFITVWASFWVGLMYTQPNRSKPEKIRHILGWCAVALLVNQFINHGAIHFLPESVDPMEHAKEVMYLFSFSALMTGFVLLIGLLWFRRR